MDGIRASSEDRVAFYHIYIHTHVPPNSSLPSDREYGGHSEGLGSIP